MMGEVREGTKTHSPCKTAHSATLGGEIEFVNTRFPSVVGQIPYCSTYSNFYITGTRIRTTNNRGDGAMKINNDGHKLERVCTTDWYLAAGYAVAGGCVVGYCCHCFLDTAPPPAAAAVLGGAVAADACYCTATAGLLVETTRTTATAATTPSATITSTWLTFIS